MGAVRQRGLGFKSASLALLAFALILFFLPSHLPRQPLPPGAAGSYLFDAAVGHRSFDDRAWMRRVEEKDGDAVVFLPPSPTFMGPELVASDVELFAECSAALDRIAVPAESRRSRRAPMEALRAYSGGFRSLFGTDFPRAPALADWALWTKTHLAPLLGGNNSAAPFPYLTTAPGDPEEALHALPPPQNPLADSCVFTGHAQCDLHILGSAPGGGGWGPNDAGKCGPLNRSAATGGGGGGGGTGTLADAHPCLPHAPYALVSLQQTLEHLYDPLLALLRLRRLLRPGGYLHTTAPTYNRPHMTPHHFWGVTPCGMYALFRRAGLSTEALGWWGNRLYAEGLVKSGVWLDFRSLGMAGEGDILIPSDGEMAMQAWGLARRPPEEGSAPSSSSPPFEEPFPLSSRPLLDVGAMDIVLTRHAADPAIPQGATALRLFRANPQWASAAADRLAVAAAIADFFLVPPSLPLLPSEPSSPACGGSAERTPGASCAPSVLRVGAPPLLLVYGTLAELAGAALRNSSEARLVAWAPGARPSACQGRATGCTLGAAGALVSDLWAARIDPYGALRELITHLAPGAPVFVTCRVTDDVRATTPGLGLCTRQGLVATLVRAGLAISHLGGFGSGGYALEMLAGAKGPMQSAAAEFFRDAPEEGASEAHDLALAGHFRTILEQRGRAIDGGDHIEATVWAVGNVAGGAGVGGA
jgi:hypothetical protein